MKWKYLVPYSQASLKLIFQLLTSHFLIGSKLNGIIDLTFNKDGVYRVIPVVSSPTDIVNGFTAPPQELEWWKILLAVVLIILLLIVLAPVLPYILKAIVWIIMLPFKAVKAIVESIKKKKKKDTGGANENG